MTIDRDSALKAVRAAYKAHDFGEARALAEALVHREPLDADGWTWVGIVALTQSRYPDAITAFDRRVTIGADAWSYVQLGRCHAKLGALDDALRCYSRALELAPDAAAYTGMATVLHGMRRFDEALKAIEAAERLSADSLDAALRRGCTLTELERYDEAATAFERAVNLTNGPSVAGLLAFDKATFETLAHSKPVVAPPSVAFERSSATRPAAVVLVSCDTIYARRYGMPFVRSYAAHAQGDHHLHVHVYDPDATIVDELSHVAAAARVAGLTITTESTAFADDAAFQRKAYYALGRLVHLPRWLDDYGVPIMSLDVDLIVEGPLQALIGRNPGADLVLNRRDPCVAPWLDIGANVVIARPTPAAADYLFKVGAYAMRRLATHPQPWLMDQCALFCVLRMLERFGVPPCIEWASNAQAIGMWHLCHDHEHALSDPRFRRYA